MIGTVQALIVERTNTPGRNLALFGAIISLGVPHILYTVAWLLLLGRSGPLNDLIALITQQPQAINVYSMWEMILIQGIGFVPLTFLLMSAVFRSMDASFEEAAIVRRRKSAARVLGGDDRDGGAGNLRAGHADLHQDV